MSESKNEGFIIKWSIFLFAVTVLATLFLDKKSHLLIGLAVGTAVSITKFVYNSYFFDRLLKNKSGQNNIVIVLSNIFITIFIVFCICMIFKAISIVNIYSMIGLLIGFCYIPTVIVIAGILQSLYIIRNKI